MNANNERQQRVQTLNANKMNAGNKTNIERY